tara:strand:- start:96 stop:647 length:552 start_codon:yes stop_codon:yes gene_type:complete
MTDKKKSKYIRLSCEYYGGFYFKKDYEYWDIDATEGEIFETYKGIDEGWLVVKNLKKFKWKEQIKFNKRAKTYFVNDNVKIDNKDVIKFHSIDPTNKEFKATKERIYHIYCKRTKEWCENIIKELEAEIKAGGKEISELNVEEYFYIDNFELPVRVEFINDFNVPYKRLTKKFTLEDEKGFKE